MGIVVDHFLVREATQKADSWSCKFVQALFIAPAADDHQRFLKLVASLNGQINTLVRNEPAHNQEIIFELDIRVKREAAHLDRWRDDHCIATIVFLYAFSDYGRVSDKVIDAHSGCLIPHAQAG